MSTTYTDREGREVYVKSNGHSRPLVSFLELPHELWDDQFDYVRELGECEGHESLRGDSMGVTVYCDDTCKPTPDEWHDRRFFEYRGSWYDLYDGFEAANPPTWIRDAGFNAWQTQSAFSAVIVRYFGDDDSTLLDDGDSIVVGYAHW